MKLFFPKVGRCCHAIVSTYGGGIVRGDALHLDLQCGADTCLYLTSTGYMQVYKGCSSSTIRGVLKDNAVVVFHGRPVVPHAQSDFKQSAHWELQSSSTLFSVDWLLPGRTARGEDFAFEQFSSELKISVNGGQTFLDRFLVRPQAQSMDSQSAFGGYKALLTITLLGPRAEPVAEALAQHFHKPLGPRRAEYAPEVLVSFGPLPKGGHQLRAAAAERRLLEEVERKFFDVLQVAEVLDFDPLCHL